MNEKTKNIIMNFIGILFIILGVGAIINTIYHINLSLAPILWLCYICIILLGIGALTKNYLLLVSQLNILAIPLLFWNIDFYYILFTGNSLLGIADYFFISGPLIGKLITLQHLFTVPLTIYALYLIKIKSNYIWLISFLEITIVFFITRLISSPEQNINCVFSPCVNFSVPYYHLTWFVGFFIIIFITNFVLRKIPFLRSKNY